MGVVRRLLVIADLSIQSRQWWCLIVVAVGVVAVVLVVMTIVAGGSGGDYRGADRVT